MKTKLFLKTLLVAVCLFVGSNGAWAADTFLTTWTGQVGTATNSGNFKYATKKVKIAAGETYVYTLTNFNDGNNSNYWKNWVVEGYLDGKYFDCEARGNQWNAGDGPVPSYTPVMAYTDVENFQTAYNGANVTITVSRNAAGDEFTVTHTSNVLGTTDGNTDKYYGGTWTVAVGAEEEWEIYITEEEAHFVVNSVTYTDAESNVTNYNPVYQRGYATSWTEDSDLTEWVGTGDGKKRSRISDGAFDFYAPNEGTNPGVKDAAAYTKTISNGDNTVLVLTALWNPGGSTSDNSRYSYFAFGDVEIRNYSNGRTSKISIAGVESSLYSAGNSPDYHRSDAYFWTIEMIVDLNRKTVDYSVTFPDGHTETGSGSSSDVFTSIAVGTNTNGHRAVGTIGKVKSIIVSGYEEEAENVDFTVKFQDTSGNTLKDDVVHDHGVVGEVYQATSEDMATFYSNDESKKYVYKSGQNTSVNASATASENVITLVFDTYEKLTYDVYAVNSSSVRLQEDPIATATFYEDETAKLTWSKYVKIGGTWYSTSETTFSTTVTEAGSRNVVYSASNVSQFVEANSSNWASTSQEDSKYSNGTAFRGIGSNSRTMFTVENTGIYSLTIVSCSYNTNKTAELAVYKNDVSDEANKLTDDISITWSVNYINTTGVKTINNISLESGDKIILKGVTEGSLIILDYVTLTLTAVSVTIPSSGFGTIASAYALDLDNVTVSDGTLTAYQVNEITKDYAKLAIVGGSVAAATGLILEGKPGATCTIPVAESGTDISSTNLLQAAVNATEVAENDAYILKNGEFHKVTTASTIPAGKAYLLADDVPVEARTLSFFFEDDETTTGIADVRSETSDVRGGFFDLQGRKINGQLPKGLYIVNGKKVVIK